jgi:rhodanese-related sulfurtransferase
MCYLNLYMMKKEDTITMGKKGMAWMLVAGLVFGSALAGSYLYTFPSTAEALSRTQIIKDVSPQEANSLLQKNKNNRNFVILDVRTPAEFKEGHIAGAINIDYHAPTFKEQLNGLDKTKVYLLYCRTARRSRAALEMMRELGFQEVYRMLGGIVGWQAEGLPTTK